jgi:hypothetical protein
MRIETTAAGTVMWTTALALVAGALTGRGVDAQSALRIRGTTTAGGTGVAATVEAEAVHGFRGGQFAGQRTFSVRSSRDGKWTILGITAGAWVFGAHTPSHFPQVAGVPVQFAQRNPASAVGGQAPWEMAFELVPREAHPALASVANDVLNGTRVPLAERFASLFETASPDALVVAGEMALYARDTAVARALFQQALGHAPGLARAHLGLATAALVEGFWENAAQSYWTARDKGLPPMMAKTVGAAIAEFQKLGGPLDRFRCPGGLPGC